MTMNGSLTSLWIEEIWFFPHLKEKMGWTWTSMDMDVMLHVKYKGIKLNIMKKSGALEDWHCQFIEIRE